MTEHSSTTALFKALADPTRLHILQQLQAGPCHGEELAIALGVTAATVSHHLKKLERVDLITLRREQYYVVSHLRDEVLDQPLSDLIAAVDFASTDAEQRLAGYRQQVLDRFFTAGRLRRLPTQSKKRLIVLAAFAADFATERDYTESEVDASISRRFADHAAVRRELVEARLMKRTSIPGQALSYRRAAGRFDVSPLSPPEPRA